MNRFLRWLARSEYERGYSDARAATTRAFPIPLLHPTNWPDNETIGFVKLGWEWIADKASRQNVADYNADTASAAQPAEGDAE